MLSLSMFILIIAGCGNRDEKPGSAMSEAELLAAARQLDSSFLAAFNAGDVNAFMQLYWKSPELTAYPPARVMQLKGYDAVKDFYTRDFNANKGARLEYTSNTNMVLKDAVTGHGIFKWTMEVPGGEPVVMEARHTVIKAMKEGRMVIVVDHASVPVMKAN